MDCFIKKITLLGLSQIILNIMILNTKPDCLREGDGKERTRKRDITSADYFHDFFFLISLKERKSPRKKN